jgi:hypothetical protein
METESLGLDLSLSRISVCLGSRRDYLCICLVFALQSFKHFCTFFDSFDKKSSFSLIIWSFKENLKTLALSTSKIRQLTRSDKKHNARKIEKTKIQKTKTENETISPESLGLGTSLNRLKLHLISVSFDTTSFARRKS